MIFHPTASVHVMRNEIINLGIDGRGIELLDIFNKKFLRSFTVARCRRHIGSVKVAACPRNQNHQNAPRETSPGRFALGQSACRQLDSYSLCTFPNVQAGVGYNKKMGEES